MAKKFHLKDDGTPGECSAATTDSCPKTQAGDGFQLRRVDGSTPNLSDLQTVWKHGRMATVPDFPSR